MSDIYPRSSFPIYLNIPVGLIGMDVVFYMRPNTVNTMRSYLQVGYPLCALYLQKKLTSTERMNMTKETRVVMSFSVTSGNLYNIKDKMRIVQSWFSEENKKILYGTNDSGMLMFNSEYKDLNVLCVSEFGNTRTAIKIVPAVIEVGNGVLQPGVIFYINKQDNGILMRESEILRFCDFILGFEFVTYANFVMSCVDYADKCGQLISYEEMLRRMQMNRSYDTNIR